MTRALFLCDGATVPREWRKLDWDAQYPINHRGTAKQTLNLRLQNLGETVLDNIEPRAADLVRIAAYAYAADLSVRRGGERDPYNRKWRRSLHLAVPVGDRDFWEAPDTSRRLSDALGFLSDDDWTFDFADAAPDLAQLPLDLSDRKLLDTPDSVVLLSGGADSLCATVDQVTNHARRPLLVSHRPSPNIDSRQKRVVADIRSALPQWSFPHISCWVNRQGSEAPERSRRSRSFLFACLGAAIAFSLGIRKVFLADNGVISLNLPFNDQLVGSLNTRSTHPRFLYFFNELVRHTLGPNLTVSNPLENMTRAESLKILRDACVPRLLHSTVSCANARAQLKATPHCGVCLQCLDRRFGSLAAGLEDHDPGEFYGTDVFLQSIDAGLKRSLVTSLVGFARRINSTERNDDFSARFPQVFDCVLDTDPDPDQTASNLIALLRRWSGEWLDVLNAQVSQNSRVLAEGQLPPDSLLRLVAASEQVSSQSPDSPQEEFTASDGYHTVTFRGQSYTLTDSQAAVVGVLDKNAKRGTPDVNQHTVLAEIESDAERLRDLFRESPLWGMLIIQGERRGHYKLNI